MAQESDPKPTHDNARSDAQTDAPSGEQSGVSSDARTTPRTRASSQVNQGAPGGVEIAPNVYMPDGELRFSFSRSSGPGGQNVNKVSTKARLEVSFSALKNALGEIFFHRLLEALGPAHIVEQSHIVIVTDESRSQISNRQTCMEKLRQYVIEAKKPRKRRRATKPTKGSKRRRLDAKKQRGEKKNMRKRPDV